MINVIGNNIYNNKLGEETFLSRVQKINREAEKQETLVNDDDEVNIHESEIVEKTKEIEIARKLAKGETVSLKDLKYIKKHNPELLQKAKKVKMSKEKIKLKIKSAKDENEVDNIIEQEYLKSLTSMVSDCKSGELNGEEQIANEAVNKIKNETGYKRVNRLV